jgi:hypothetical protein
MQKTFKIGESAIGGIVEVKTRKREVYEVTCFDWTTKEKVSWRFVYGLQELEEYLTDISTSYWADKIVTHFKK